MVQETVAKRKYGNESSTYMHLDGFEGKLYLRFKNVERKTGHI